MVQKMGARQYQLPKKICLPIFAFSMSLCLVIAYAIFGQVSTHSRDGIVSWIAHSAEITAIEISPSGRILATGDSNGEIRCWDRSRKALIFASNIQRESISDIGFLSENELIVSSQDGTAVCYCIGSDGMFYKIRSLDAGGLSKIVVNDKHDVFINSMRGILKVSMDSIEVVLPAARSIGITSDGLIARGQVNYSISIGDPSKGGEVKRFVLPKSHENQQLPATVRSIHFSKDGEMLVGLLDKTQSCILTVDYGTEKLKRILSSPGTSRYTDAEYSVCNRYVIASGSQVFVWDRSNQKIVRQVNKTLIGKQKISEFKFGPIATFQDPNAVRCYVGCSDGGILEFIIDQKQ
jgi:WD40 repeat protein